MRGISLHSHLDPPLSPEIIRRLARPHRTSHYFLMFVRTGSVEYEVDLRTVPVSAGQVLFVRPHQVRVPPLTRVSGEYFKITFDEACFAKLPRTYQFWLDPWDERRINLPQQAWERFGTVFDLLRQTLRTEGGSSEVMIAYLNAVMSELEHAYFASERSRGQTRNIEAFLRFQSLVEKEFVHRPQVSEVARTVGVSESALYSIVKEFSNFSPKEYLNRRVALEAQRLLFYSGMSTKELAAHLGFDDENYFSRFFRKCTGRSISAFLASSEDLSRTSEDSSLTRR